MSEHPDLIPADALAEHFGVSVGVVLGACGVLAIDATLGVHQSYTETIRQVIVQWMREGKI